MDTCYRCGHEKLFHNQKDGCRKRSQPWRSRFKLPFYKYEKMATKPCGCIAFVEGYYGPRDTYWNPWERRRPFLPLFRGKKRPHRNDNRKQGKIREVKR